MDMSDNKSQIFKSYEELAQTEVYTRWLNDEFPDREGLLDVDRRDFLKLGAATMALAGLAGCRPLAEVRAVPYVRAPENQAMGHAYSYATTLSLSGYGRGVLVEQHEGRPTKIEGNPNHPSSLGSTDVWAQAEILNLYDPDRSQAVRRLADPASWDEHNTVLLDVLKSLPEGEGFRLLTEVIVSPSVAAAIEAFLKLYPKAVWHQWQPINRDNVLEGTKLAFGKPLNPVYDLTSAKVVVSLDADFLMSMPGSVRYARDWAETRRVRKSSPKMSRLYAFESSYSVTGASADHRLPVKPSEIEAIARALYAKLAGGSAPLVLSESAVKFVDAVAKDLAENNGASVVIPGEEQSPAVHALAQAINAKLSATGRTVRYTAPVEARPESAVASIKALADAANAGAVKGLLILGGNPVYDAPADLKLGEALTALEAGKEKIPYRAHLSRYEDETSELCHWHLPESHDLEAWGDARGHDGTVSLVQPLIEPLYDSRSVLEVVSLHAGKPAPGIELVRANYAVTDDVWQTVLEKGVVPNNDAAQAIPVTPVADVLGALPAAPAASGIEVNFRPDPTLWDGSFANNAWLQELPKPITTVVWDNAAIISPQTAIDLKVIPAYGDSDAVNIAQHSGRQKIRVRVGDGSLEIPVWILPGQPNGVVTLYLGSGRVRAGHIGTDIGFDTYSVRQSGGLGYATGASIEATGETYEMVYTQPHHLMRSEFVESVNRDIVRSSRLDHYAEKGGVIFEEIVHHDFTDAGHGEGHGDEHVESGDVVADWYRQEWKYEKADPSRKNDANKEGVLVSLSGVLPSRLQPVGDVDRSFRTASGVTSCTIACQAENNIPVVGKDQVWRGREMHWIRIGPLLRDARRQESREGGQPLPSDSVHAVRKSALRAGLSGRGDGSLPRGVEPEWSTTAASERATAPTTAPTRFGASTSSSGRRPTRLARAVSTSSVRGRRSRCSQTRTSRFADAAVMEKCTYCVQRINEVRIDAKKEGREIKDGEIVTACQQACPTGAIVFGDVNDPKSAVSMLKAEPHDYGLLTDLNTRPRTTYLARIKNPNPELEPLPVEAAKAGRTRVNGASRTSPSGRRPGSSRRTSSTVATTTSRSPTSSRGWFSTRVRRSGGLGWWASR